MFVIREVMYCKPGKVRPLLEKFRAMSALMQKLNMGRMRVMTDVAAERYWTLVSEMDVPDLKMLDDMSAPPPGATAEDMKEFEKIMKDYHELVDYGKREIYKIEV